MQKFKTGSSLSLLLIFLVFVQCNRENEEDESYYEPLVDGIYEIMTDNEKAVDFIIEPAKEIAVEGELDNGMQFRLDFPVGAYRNPESMPARVIPLTGIQNFPSDYTFHFGLALLPEGTYFTKPGKLSVELPEDFDISSFKGFTFEGGSPLNSGDAEIYEIMMTPVEFKELDGKKYAVFEVPHFSGIFGITGDDFPCGDPDNADYCEELKEILACYIAGKEELKDDDIKKANNALRTWLKNALNWLENHPEDMDEYWEVWRNAQQITCWKASAQYFNSDLEAFSDLIDRTRILFSDAVVNLLVTANEECLQAEDLYTKRSIYESNFELMSLAVDLEAAGMIDENITITPDNFCNSLATSLYIEPFLDTAESHIHKSHYSYHYLVSFPPEVSPAVSRSISVKVYAYNLLYEPVALTYGEDYTIHPFDDYEGFTIDGMTFTEITKTCTDGKGNYYSCYPPVSGRMIVELPLEFVMLSFEVVRLPSGYNPP